MNRVRRARLVTAGLCVVAVGFIVGFVIGGATGLVVVLAAGQLILLALVLAAWRELIRSHRSLRTELHAVGTEVRQESAQLRSDVARRSQELRRQVATQVVSEVTTRLTSEVRAQARESQEDLARLRNAFDNQFRQIEALGALYYGIQPRQPLPRTRYWAASPDLLHHLYEITRRGRQRLIVECGSGVSTLVFAYALRARGEGKVVALDHLAQYAEATTVLLREHGLEEWAEVRLAPLQPVAVDGETWPWYDLSEVPPGPIDLLLVDGPPGATRQHARFPALPLLHDRLAADAVVVLDDHDRKDEREVAQRWRALFPDCRTETLPHEKGTAILTRRSR